MKHWRSQCHLHLLLQSVPRISNKTSNQSVQSYEKMVSAGHPSGTRGIWRTMMRRATMWADGMKWPWLGKLFEALYLDQTSIYCKAKVLLTWDTILTRGAAGVVSLGFWNGAPSDSVEACGHRQQNCTFCYYNVKYIFKPFVNTRSLSYNRQRWCGYSHIYRYEHYKHYMRAFQIFSNGPL